MRQRTRHRNGTHFWQVIGFPLAALLCLVGYAQAGLSIVNVNQSYPLGTGVVSIPIAVNGLSTDVVDGMDIFVEIAKVGFVAGVGRYPGAGPGDTGGPTPTIGYVGNGGINGSGDSSGNFMFSSPHSAINYISSSDQWNLVFGEALNIAAANIPANTDGGGGPGLLLTLQVDFTGFNSIPGTWRIIMDAQNGSGTTQFGKYDPTSPFLVRIVPLDLSQANFSVSIVPEPASLVMAGMGLASLLGCVWRRRGRK